MTRALRILHVQKASGIGGSERHLLDLLPALSSAGHDVRMLVLTAGEWRRFAEPLAARGVAVRTAPGGADLDPRASLAIRRAIAAQRPDIVHTHLIHADVYGQPAARSTGVAGISTAHGTGREFRGGPSRLAARAAGHLARRTIAISEHVRRFLEDERIPRPGTVRVVHYGIDVDARHLSPDARAGVRRRLGLGDGEVAVCVASRLVEGKGHAALLDAVAAALPGTPGLVLLVAGDGPLRPALEARARLLPEGVVRFLGFLDDTREVIGASDVVVFPTLPALGEGFGLAALEAMAAGVPVVVSDVGALPEVVEDGRTGLVVPGGDVGELAAALRRIAADPAERERWGEVGRARASERFSLGAMVDATIAVYAEALEERA